MERTEEYKQTTLDSLLEGKGSSKKEEKVKPPESEPLEKALKRIRNIGRAIQADLTGKPKG